MRRRAGAQSFEKKAEPRLRRFLVDTQTLARALAEKLRHRSFECPVRILEAQETHGAALLGVRFDLVDLLARKRCAARHTNTAHAAARFERGSRDAEVGATERLAR